MAPTYVSLEENGLELDEDPTSVGEMGLKSFFKRWAMPVATLILLATNSMSLLHLRSANRDIGNSDAGPFDYGKFYLARRESSYRRKATSNSSAH